MKKDTASPGLKLVAIVSSSLASLGLILIVFFWNDIFLSSLSIYCSILISFLAVVLFITALVLSIIRLVNTGRQRKWDYLPLLLLIASILIVVIAPLQEVKGLIDFYSVRQEAEAAIAWFDNKTEEDLAEEGVRVGNRVRYQLPKELEHLTADGHIEVFQGSKTEQYIYFCRYGFLDFDSGLLFVRDGSATQDWLSVGDTVMLGWPYSVRQSFGDGWYRVAAID